MKKAIRGFTVLVLAAGISGCASVRMAYEPAGPSFRMLTYNVHEGMPNPTNTLRVILGAGADTVLMQESCPDWANLIRSSVEQSYPHVLSRFDSHFGSTNGFTVLSRWPCKEVAFMDDEDSLFDGWLLELDTPIGKVHALSVHLDAPSDRKSRPAIIPYLRTPRLRRQKIARYYGDTRCDRPLIVAGDFNEGNHGAAVRWLQKQGMRNALPLYDRRSPTWAGAWWFIPLRFRLDHILFSPDLRCSSSGVIAGGGSDHRAVWAVLHRDEGLRAESTRKLRDDANED